MRTKRASHTAVCHSVVSGYLWQKDPKFLLEVRITNKNPDKCKPEAGGRNLVHCSGLPEEFLTMGNPEVQGRGSCGRQWCFNWGKVPKRKASYITISNLFTNNAPPGMSQFPLISAWEPTEPKGRVYGVRGMCRGQRKQASSSSPRYQTNTLWKGGGKTQGSFY